MNIGIQNSEKRMLDDTIFRWGLKSMHRILTTKTLYAGTWLYNNPACQPWPNTTTVVSTSDEENGDRGGLAERQGMVLGRSSG